MSKATFYKFSADSQYLNIPKKNFQVVHNYGHGGNGVALSWGTAVHAANLVLEGLDVKARL